MKNILVRSLSGTVYVALIVCSILFGGVWAFPALCCLFVFIGIIEFQKMTQDDFYKSPRSLFVDLLIGISFPALMALWSLQSPFMGFIALILMGFIFVMVLLRLVMELYCHRNNPVRHISLSVFSVFYVAVPLAFATLVFFTSKALLLLVFVMIWLNDTGAFLVGSAIGSHRLFERLSPKKSWEGFFGGLIFSVAAGYFANLLFPDAFMGMPVVYLCVLGLVVSIMSTWGDLFESMIKRTVGVKDSGTIIPGHGGILDRIDSLLFVAPSVSIYLLIIQLLFSTAIIHTV
ncbi:MAG: phosphatidate cytidylyltransferase [Bacteroides sp.]|nr:phosphatidate cytidylyltransferase [Bacteroides sp.]MCM1412788.1 phosphatidate cytidylyltransferase [Bacteroides sp.]MCM1470918.1 phosphatidate cytidylyltransferase [Bacteroides sp.]